VRRPNSANSYDKNLTPSIFADETCSCSRLAMNSVFLANLALFCPSMKSLNLKAVWKDLGMVEPTGIEPATFSLRTRRSTN
jgi:hypothetical protein